MSIIVFTILCVWVSFVEVCASRLLVIKQVAWLTKHQPDECSCCILTECLLCDDTRPVGGAEVMGGLWIWVCGFIS